MLSTFLGLMTLMLSIPTTSANNDIVGISSDGTGCTGILASTNQGFDAKFYTYPNIFNVDFYDNSYVANGYSSNALVSTASNIVSPNFSITQDVASASLYGITEANLKYIVIELTGYFVGKYIFIILFILQIQNTNFYFIIDLFVFFYNSS